MIERRMPMATEDDVGDDGRMGAEMDREADEGVAPGRRAPRERVTREPGAPPTVDEADGVLDELQAWYLVRAERERWVYTSVLRQLINRMYRERDYLAVRKRDGRRTAYDFAVDRDQVALAWAIRELVRLMPPEEKAKPEPPRKPRTPKRRLSPEEKAKYRGVPSWNGQPKRGWAGIELPDRPPRREHNGRGESRHGGSRE
jgi:hypothetical protein